jgi:hypothetical protein
MGEIMTEIIEQGGSGPSLAGRAKAILVSPRAEWPKIAGESESVQTAFMRYVVPLAAIGPICGFIGGQVFGIGVLGFRYHPSLLAGLSAAITGYILALLSIFVVARVAKFLADKFGGKENFARAFRLCAYSFTAAYLAGVFQLLPSLAVLGLIAALYGIYLFYLGATPMMAVPQDKAVGYTALTIVGVIVVYLVVGALTAAVTGAFGSTPAIGANALDGGAVEMTVPGYGKVKLEDHGDSQTMEIPGVGTVHVTKDGDTVKIDGDNIKAEVKDPNAGT